MKKCNLKYYNYEIVFQEVPNEVSLAFNITNCPHRCPECHSKFLWDDIGEELSSNIKDIIKKYDNLITCVCFLGGDQNLSELIELLRVIKKKYKLKTCLYTGLDDTYGLIDTIPYLDYLKIGHYDSQYGGLDSPNTNQKFFKNIDCNLIDYTSLFQKRGI